MDEHLTNLSKGKKLPNINDDDFCVSITKATELSGLTESQIRYLDTLPSITIGKRRLGERNRVYSKLDVMLLRWIAEQEGRPSDIIDRFNKQQEKILRELGHVTLQQVIDAERSALGHDVLVSRLVTLLLSIWRETMQAMKVDATILCVIFGPQDEDWKASFLESCKEKRSFDLTHSLIVWSDPPKDDVFQDANAISSNLSIIYSRQSWYLPFDEKVIFDTSRFTNSNDPFAVAVLWLPTYDRAGEDKKLESSVQKKLETSAQYLNRSKSKKKLVDLLMRSFRFVIRRSGQSVNIPVVVYLRSGMGEYSVIQCLRLLLDTCIRPYFSDCYYYVGRFDSNGELVLLAQGGEKTAGYLPVAKSNHDTPWWISFVRDRAGLALAQDVRTGPMHKSEYGSVVCFPLMALEKVVGVLGIEITDRTKHCLTERHGYVDADLLRYLICISEIAAEYLSLMESSAQKAERSRVAYVTEEAVNWWLNIYRFGGSDYTRIAEKVYDWLEQENLRTQDAFYVILIDIYNEGELTATYQGVEVIIYIVQKLKERLKEFLANDPIAANLLNAHQLAILEEPVGDHLLFAEVQIPRDYLLMLLEQIREFWQHTNDDLIWKGVKVQHFTLQVGACRFVGLADYDKKMASRIMNYHLKKLAQQLYVRHQGQPLNHVLEYEAAILTEKIVE